jgi:hypothetical protein
MLTLHTYMYILLVFLLLRVAMLSSLLLLVVGATAVACVNAVADILAVADIFLVPNVITVECLPAIAGVPELIVLVDFKAVYPGVPPGIFAGFPGVAHFLSFEEICQYPRVTQYW